MSEFAKEILKEFAEPVVTMTETELAAKLAAGAEGGSEGSAGAAAGDGTPAGTPPAAGTEGGTKTAEGEEGTTAKPAGEEHVKGPKAVAPTPPKPPAVDPKAEEGELDDEKILAALKKKFPGITSLDDFKPHQKEPTAEEVAEAQKELASKAIQHGLKTKQFTPEDLEQYNLAKNREPRDLALEAFGNFLRKEEPELSDDDIEDRFATYYGEALADDHWMKAIKTKEMNDLAQKYLNGKYRAITNATNDYSETVRVEQEARTYKSEVEQVFSVPSEVTMKVKGKEYQFKPTAETVNAIKEQFLSSEQFGAFGNKMPDKALLEASIKTAIISRDFDRIVESVANSHAAAVLAEKMAGRKGVVPTREAGSDEHGEASVYTGRALGVIEETLKG